jgi:WD40 repeat protein
MLATASEDGKVIFWYAEDGFPTRSLNAQVDAKAPNARKLPGVMSVQYARNGQIATCGRDNTARIWRPDGNLVARLEGFTDLPTRVTFSHDGERLFVGDFTGKVRVWSVKDPKQPLGELSSKND